MMSSVNLPLSPSILSLVVNSPRFSRPSKKFLRITASSAGSDESRTTGKSTLASVLEVPKTLWRRTLQPLGDYGFGRRGVWEGGVGLFMVSGTALFALAIVWLRGIQMRSRFRKYQVVFEFSQAAGICVGTPVRIRGVTVGSVVRVGSSLKSIDAVVEVEDDKIFVPRNSLVEVNQSGLLMETLIDITPRDPLPEPSVGPLDTDCVKEALIVCDRQKIKGQQGVSLDSLIGVFTRLGREMEEIGVSRSYRLAEKVASVVEEAQPLLAKIEVLAEDIQPLLAEVRDSTLLKDVESLTKSLAMATEDLRLNLPSSCRKVQSAILTPENADLIKQSIFTLIFTLKNIESISSDISSFTGDEATRRNLKLLIKSLSRLL
ncbi:protein TRIGALACTOSYLDIACYLGLYCEROL 2, chloroplastic-like isoform X3 [Zingiber officinale]|uniref:protein TRIGALACTOSYLDIACYLGLYCEROL 2, chloroplastic-like isoform X3 n=1 Tax=Zingiber officinale TaxID=94328 RepID=UPI001C4AFBD6|nr:protein TRIGALACTOSYLDIACYLGLYCEROL 2, chloroplastic-like isoform X3 [Zingiber officinale]